VVVYDSGDAVGMGMVECTRRTKKAQQKMVHCNLQSSTIRRQAEEIYGQVRKAADQ
jgi:hypothetical protein